MGTTANLCHEQGITGHAPFDFSANMKKKAQWRQTRAGQCPKPAKPVEKATLTACHRCVFRRNVGQVVR